MNGGGSGARAWRFLAWMSVIALILTAALFMKRMIPKPANPEPPVEPAPPEPVRVAAARRRCGAKLRAMFAKAGIHWPADEVFLRVMKREGQIELWARNGAGEPFRLVEWLPITAQSGGPGPKRREGDMQVPEGFYHVDRFNPFSNFHLSLGLNYPNARDLRDGDPVSPGFDIFIHGGNASIGCVALGDDGVEEIYLAASDSRARPVRVHLFPARMDTPDWPEWRDAQLAEHPGFRPLWNELATEWERFARERR